MSELTEEDQLALENRRKKLRQAIERAGGTWDEGWQSIGTIRKSGATSGRLDVFFMSPGPQRVRVRSIKEALELLGLTGAAASQGRTSASGPQDGSLRPREPRREASLNAAVAETPRDGEHKGHATASSNQEIVSKNEATTSACTANHNVEQPVWDSSHGLYSWEELQAGILRPSGGYMSEAEIEACEAIRLKAEATLRECQIAALATNEVQEWFLCFHQHMMVAAQSLPGASHRLLMGIFDSCAGPCEAHLHAALVAALAGCQLHKNLIDDITAKLELERSRWEWEHRHADRGGAWPAHAAPPVEAEGCNPCPGTHSPNIVVAAGASPPPQEASAQGLQLAYAANEQQATSELQGGVSEAASECESKHSGNASTGAHRLQHASLREMDGQVLKAVSRLERDDTLNIGQEQPNYADHVPLSRAESVSEGGSDAVGVASCEAAPISAANGNAANGDAETRREGRGNGCGREESKRISGKALEPVGGLEGKSELTRGPVNENGAEQGVLGQQEQEEGALVAQRKRKREKGDEEVGARVPAALSQGSGRRHRRRRRGVQFNGEV